MEVPYEINSDEALPAHVIAGIKKGQEDIKSGKSLSFDEFKEKIVII